MLDEASLKVSVNVLAKGGCGRRAWICRSGSGF
jgi:hypothetical protein